MRKPTFGQRRGKPIAAGARDAAGAPIRRRPSRLDANFPEARGTLAAPGAGKGSPAKRWTKRVRPGAKPKPEATETAGARMQPTPTAAPRATGRASVASAAKVPGARPPSPKSTASGRVTERARIAKAMARAGLCSRRDAERWIAEGRVSVNGKIIASPALDVGPGDTIAVDGAPLPDTEPLRLWRYHKPRGLVTTHRDPEGRPTVFDHLPPELPRVVSIGRLDFNTEGLLLLTNDGALARHLELPSTGWLRKYRVRAHGSITQARLDVLKDGIEIDGVRYGPIEATLDSLQGRNCWLTLGLREGKNREVRNILGSLELAVNRLIRISFGPFQLLDLEEGKVESIKRRVLADQLGPDLTKTFGLDKVEEPIAAPTKSRKPQR